MLSEANLNATLPVKDLKAAEKFYTEVLGLQEVGGEPGGLTFRSGSTKFFVYESPFAGSNRATAAAWSVTNLDSLVAELKEKGVVFEHYDLPGVTVQGDVHVTDSYRVAWFRDPDGNILALDDLASSR